MEERDLPVSLRKDFVDLTGTGPLRREQLPPSVRKEFVDLTGTGSIREEMGVPPSVRGESVDLTQVGPMGDLYAPISLPTRIFGRIGATSIGGRAIVPRGMQFQAFEEPEPENVKDEPFPPIPTPELPGGTSVGIPPAAPPRSIPMGFRDAIGRLRRIVMLNKGFWWLLRDMIEDEWNRMLDVFLAGESAYGGVYPNVPVVIAGRLRNCVKDNRERTWKLLSEWEDRHGLLSYAENKLINAQLELVLQKMDTMVDIVRIMWNFYHNEADEQLREFLKRLGESWNSLIDSKESSIGLIQRMLHAAEPSDGK